MAMNRDLLQRAIKKWGVAKQVTQAMEECGELIAAINRYFFRDRIKVAELAGEIADVELCCLQLREIIGDKEVDEIKKEKIARLEERLNE